MRYLLMLGCLSTLSCGGSDSSPTQPPPSAVPTAILVTPATPVLSQGASLRLQAVVVDSRGDTLPSAEALLSLESSDTTRLLVSQDGTLSAIGRAGLVVVFARSGRLTRNITVRISPLPTTIIFNRDTAVIGSGGWTQIRASVLDLAGDPIATATPALTVNNQSMLNLLAADYVKSTGALGLTGVSASYAGVPGAVLPVRIVPAVHPAGVLRHSIQVGGTMTGVDIAPDGVVLAYRNSLPFTGMVRLPLPGTMAIPLLPGVGPGPGLAIAPAGDAAYVLGSDLYGPGSMWEVALPAGTLIREVTVPDGRAVGVTPDGQLLIVTTEHQYMLIYDRATLTKLDSVRVQALRPGFLAMHPTATLVYLSDEFNGIFEVDYGAKAVTRVLTGGSAGEGLAVSPDGSKLYVVLSGNGLTTFDLATGARLNLVLGLGGYGAALSPDGARMYVAGDRNLKIIDPRVPVLLDSLYFPSGDIRRVAFSRDGGTAIVTDASGWLHVIE